MYFLIVEKVGLRLLLLYDMYVHVSLGFFHLNYWCSAKVYWDSLNNAKLFNKYLKRGVDLTSVNFPDQAVVFWELKS